MSKQDSSIELLDELIYDMRYKRTPITLADLMELRASMDAEYQIYDADEDSTCEVCGHIQSCRTSA